MKNLKHKVAVAVRSAVTLLPGVAAAIYVNDMPGYMVAILAGIGAIFVTSVVVILLLNLVAKITAQVRFNRESRQDPG